MATYNASSETKTPRGKGQNVSRNEQKALSAIKAAESILKPNTTSSSSITTHASLVSNVLNLSQPNLNATTKFTVLEGKVPKVRSPPISPNTNKQGYFSEYLDQISEQFGHPDPEPFSPNLSDEDDTFHVVTPQNQKTHSPAKPTSVLQSPSGSPAAPVNKNVQNKATPVVYENVPTTYRTISAMFRTIKMYHPDAKIDSIKLPAYGALVFPSNQETAVSLLKMHKQLFGKFTSQVHVRPAGLKTGSASVVKPSANSQPKIFSAVLRNINFDVDVKDLACELKQNYKSITYVSRVISASTGNPCPMVRVNFQEESDCQHLIQNGFTYLFLVCPAEASVKQTKILQCYTCQQFNHGSRTCQRQAVCARCSGAHHISKCTNQKDETKCTNCGGNHHARAKVCPNYRKAYTNVNSTKPNSSSKPNFNYSPDSFPPLPNSSSGPSEIKTHQNYRKRQSQTRSYHVQKPPTYSIATQTSTPIVSNPHKVFELERTYARKFASFLDQLVEELFDIFSSINFTESTDEEELASQQDFYNKISALRKKFDLNHNAYFTKISDLSQNSC